MAPPSLDVDEPARDGIDEDELLGLCSGTFGDGGAGESSSLKDPIRNGNLLGDMEESQSQQNDIAHAVNKERAESIVEKKDSNEAQSSATKEQSVNRRILSSDDEDDAAKNAETEGKKKKLKKRMKKKQSKGLVESDGEEEDEGEKRVEDEDDIEGDDDDDEENDELAMFMKLSQQNQISKKQKVTIQSIRSSCEMCFSFVFFSACHSMKTTTHLSVLCCFEGGWWVWKRREEQGFL